MSFATWRGRLRQPLHPLAASHYCCSRFFFFLDIMHLLDANGVAGHVYGGIMSHLLCDVRLGRTRQARLDTVSSRISAHYATRPTSVVKLPEMHMANLTSKGWFVLHGQAFKAAIMRHAAGFFLAVVLEFCRGERNRDVFLRALITSFVAIYDAL